MDEDEPIGIKVSEALAAIPQEKLAPLYPSAAEMEETWRRNKARRIEEGQRFLEDIRKSRLDDYKRLGTIAGSGMDNIEDRLKHGDALVDNEGKVIGRRPVRLRDLTTLTGMVFERQIAIEKRILGEDEGNASTAMTPKVEALLIRLEMVSRETPITGEVRGEFREPQVIDVGEDAQR